MLSPGAWLATLLAIASVAVLAGGRMTERTRRVGLLKAVGALADPPRPPRRRPRLLAMSRGLPVPLLLGLRLVARRPRRALLGAANVAITMAGVVAVLTFHATAGQKINGGGSGLSDPVYNRDEQILLVLTVILLALAALNAVVTAWTTMLDTRHPAALARALGATPRTIAAGLTAAQLLPAVPGTLFGIPLGIGLFAAADHGGLITVPPAWWLAAAVLATLAAVAGLAAVPARVGARRPTAEILQADTA